MEERPFRIEYVKTLLSFPCISHSKPLFFLLFHVRLCNACGIKYAKKRKSQELKGGEDSEKLSKPRKRKPSTGTESSSSTGSNPTPTTEVMNLLDLGLDKMHNEWANIAT